MIIQLPSGKRITLDASPTATISALKSKVRKSESQLPQKLLLFHKNKQLSDDLSLGDYEIGDDSVVDLQYSLRMKVNTPYDGMVEIDVDPNDKVKVVKKKVEKKLGKSFDKIPLSMFNANKKEIIELIEESVELINLNVDESTRFFLKNTDKFPFKVRGLDGSIHKFEVKSTDLCKDVMKRVAKKILEADDLNLVCEEKSIYLVSDKPIGFYGLERNCTFIMEPGFDVVISHRQMRVTIHTNPEITVKELREKFISLFPKEHVEYFINTDGEMLLEDKFSLRDYMVRDGSVLVAKVRQCKKKIKIKMPDGSFRNEEFLTSDTIPIITRKMSERTNLPYDYFAFSMDKSTPKLEGRLFHMMSLFDTKAEDVDYLESVKPTKVLIKAPSGQTVTLYNASLNLVLIKRKIEKMGFMNFTMKINGKTVNPDERIQLEEGTVIEVCSKSMSPDSQPNYGMNKDYSFLF